MKLANIFALAGGATKGQAAAGTSDSGCLDIRAADSAGTLRDISQLVSTDAGGRPTVISRRLQTQTVNDYKYLTGTLTATGSNNRMCNARSVSGAYKTWCGFKGYVKFDTAAARWFCQFAPNSSTYWRFGVTSDRYLHFNSSVNGTVTNDYGPQISSGAWHYVEMQGSCMFSASDPMYNVTYRRIAVRVDGGSWAYMTTAKGGGAIDNYSQCFYGYSVSPVLGYSGLLMRGAVVMYGSNGTAAYTSTVNIENATAGSSANIADSEGLITYKPSSAIVQHTATTTEWVE